MKTDMHQTVTAKGAMGCGSQLGINAAHMARAAAKALPEL